MIHGARIEHDEDGYTLVLDSDEDTKHFPIAPDAVDELNRTLAWFRAWQAEGEEVRREFEATKNLTVERKAMDWQDYLASQARLNPEWIEGWAAAGDLARKAEKENGD